MAIRKKKPTPTVAWNCRVDPKIWEKFCDYCIKHKIKKQRASEIALWRLLNAPPGED